MSPKDHSGAVSASAVPIELRGRMLTSIVLRIRGAADDAFYEALDSLMSQAPHFFANAPLILDLGEARGLKRGADFSRLLGSLRTRRLSPIGIQSGSEQLNRAAADAGLVALATGRDRPLDRDEPAPAVQESSDSLEAALLVTEPVRSGQQIFADRGDLVVVGPVGSGAELIAHGNIHVYGPLRGRALAGVNGDEKARIFCNSLEAELIAIAGLYRTSDDLDPTVLKRRVQAYLRGDALVVEALK